MKDKAKKPEKEKKSLVRCGKFWVGVFIVLCLMIAGYVIWDILTTGPLTELFNNREEMVGIVRESGAWGPLIYVGLQFLQTVIAPIPGGAIGPIGGFLFGWAGVLWTMIGTTLGVIVIFWLAKKYGRKIAIRAVGEEVFKKFDVIPKEKAGLMIFALFLIPGLPDDVISYAAGMTKVPIGKLIGIWVIGRLPAVVVANSIGMGFEGGDLVQAVVITTIIVIAMAIIGVKSKAIVKWTRKTFGKK